MKIDLLAAPNKSSRKFFLILTVVIFGCFTVKATASDHEEGKAFNAGEMIMHHISDGHSIHFPGFTLPLPCIVRTENGMDFFMSSVFMDDHHEFTKTYTSGKTGNTYQLIHEKIYIVNSDVVVTSEVVADTTSAMPHAAAEAARDTTAVVHETLSTETVHEEGAHESHGTPVQDFSITKSVLGMFLMMALVLWLFTSMARAYRKRQGQAPKGMQNLLEPLVLFIRDEVAIPSMGKKRAKRYLPFLLSMFFFIWCCNLLGLVPFLGGFNITGTLSITLVMATMVFVITMVSGNRHYWGHIVWPPGVPFAVKIILVPIEILSVFMKPTVLMIRLTANINAGHIVILAFTSLIFIFAQQSAGAGYGVGVASTAFMVFMYFIELLVAFLQAYVFTLLAALYFGDATQEHHHEEAHSH